MARLGRCIAPRLSGGSPGSEAAGTGLTMIASQGDIDMLGIEVVLAQLVLGLGEDGSHVVRRFAP